MSTQVAANRGTLRIWRRVSLAEGGQKFWFQWQLVDTAWLACARVAATRYVAERPSNAPTQSHSLQRSHQHLNLIFESKLHAGGSTSLSYLYSSHSLTRSTSSGSCHSDWNCFTWPWKIAIIFVAVCLTVLGSHQPSGPMRRMVDGSLGCSMGPAIERWRGKGERHRREAPKGGGGVSPLEKILEKRMQNGGI